MWNTALEETNYVVKDTSRRIEDSFADHKPDISLNHRVVGKEAWHVDLPATAEDYERVAQVALAYSTSIVEVKLSAKDDPFGSGTEVECDPSGHESRVQILKSICEMFLRQHRECIYTVFIAGSRARLMRWDRCGVIVTEAFDYIEDPSDLVNFFYFLATASRQKQGYDTSMTLATKKQKAELATYRQELKDRGDRPYHLKFVDEMMENPNLYPYYQVSVIHVPLTALYSLISAAKMPGFIR